MKACHGVRLHRDLHMHLFHTGNLVGIYSNKVADLSPIHFRSLSATKPQMVLMDLNIGFQGLALIQGQIYNPEQQLKTFNFQAISCLDRPWMRH